MARRNHVPNHPAFSRALDELRPELEAIPRDQLASIRLDIAAAQVVLRPLIGRLTPFRATIASELGEDTAVHLDRLEKTAQGCFAAHAMHLTKVNGRDVEALIQRLAHTRRVLLLEGEGLVAKRLLPASTLAELVGGTGHNAMCLDVMQLVMAFRGEWAAIEAETPVTMLELDQAEALADAASIALGESSQMPASPETADIRQRAYTLFVRTYDEVRRAMTYIRWEADDVDDYAPSLFAGRTRKKDVDEDESVPVVTPVAVPVTNGSNGAPIPPGMPGAPPFVS